MKAATTSSVSLEAVPVAYDDDLYSVFVYQFLEDCLGSGYVIFWLGRVDGCIGFQLSGAVQDCYLAAGPVARVYAEDNLVLYRRRHQQALCVSGKDLDCLSLGPLGEHIPHFPFYRRCHESFICVVNGIVQQGLEDGRLFFITLSAIRPWMAS